MELVKDIALWVIAIMAYLAIGYQIGKISLQVYKEWEEKELDSAALLLPFIGLRSFLFPINSTNLILRNKMEWFAANRNKTIYIIFHMLFWPIRIWWSLLLMCLCFIATPIISFLITLIVSLIRDTCTSLRKLINQQTP